MSNYSLFFNTHIKNINDKSVELGADSFTAGGGAASGASQHAFNNVTQSGSVAISHADNSAGKYLVQVYELQPDQSGVSNTSLDFDLADEGYFTQEDSVSGTLFYLGKVQLNQTRTTEGFDPDRKGASVVLSNSNKTIQINSQYESARTVLDGVSSGKYYWEIYISNATYAMVGIYCAESLTLTYPSAMPGNYTDSVGWYFDKGMFKNNVKTSSWFSRFLSAGTTIGIALDVDNGVVRFSHNGDWNVGAAVYITPGKTYFPGVGCATSGATYTARFDQSELVYPVPAGYMPGFSAFNNVTKNSSYVTTSNSNHISLENTTTINSVTIGCSVPAKTEIKAVASLDGRNTWIAGHGGPPTLVANIGLEGTYDTKFVYTDAIIKESDTSYKMWYTGYDGTTNKILYSTSTDGLLWSDGQLVIDKGAQGTYDSGKVAYPCVIKESDTSYKMWYSGYNGTNWRIIYCTSTDGINWSNFQLVIDKGSQGTYDTTHVGYPYVIKESSSSYKMWYCGYNGVWRALYASSTNGTTWSNYQLTVNAGSEGTYDTAYLVKPMVIKESDTSYKMWYSGYDSTRYRVIYCTSTNGINWSNFQLAINYNVDGTYDTLSALSAVVIKETDNLYRVWYSARDASYARGLYAESQDGINWTSYFPETLASFGFDKIYLPAALEGVLANYTITDETFLDFAFQLETINPTFTPYIDQITINYDETGLYAIKGSSSYSVSNKNNTSTLVTKLSSGTSNIKVNVLI